MWPALTQLYPKTTPTNADHNMWICLHCSAWHHIHQQFFCSGRVCFRSLWCNWTSEEPVHKVVRLQNQSANGGYVYYHTLTWSEWGLFPWSYTFLIISLYKNLCDWGFVCELHHINVSMSSKTHKHGTSHTSMSKQVNGFAFFCWTKMVMLSATHLTATLDGNVVSNTPPFPSPATEGAKHLFPQLDGWGHLWPDQNHWPLHESTNHCATKVLTCLQSLTICTDKYTELDNMRQRQQISDIIERSKLSSHSALL